MLTNGENLTPPRNLRKRRDSRRGKWLTPSSQMAWWLACWFLSPMGATSLPALRSGIKTHKTLFAYPIFATNYRVLAYFLVDYYWYIGSRQGPTIFEVNPLPFCSRFDHFQEMLVLLSEQRAKNEG